MQNKQYQLRSQESEDERSRSRARNLSAASLARFAASWPGFRGRRMRQEWLNGSAPRRIAGYTACGLLLASVATRQGPWTLGHFAAVLGVFLFIFAMRRASWVATSDTRSADEGGIGRFSELSDRLEKRIEELQDVQWELQEKEARYRDLLDTQQDIILRRNGAGQLTFVNTAFCRTFGVKADEVLGRPFTPTVSETEGQKPRLEEISRRHRQFVERVMTKSGLCWIAWDEQLISTGSNGDFEVQGVGRDVTRERAQQEQLQEARDQSEAANRAKSRFLAAMSHEIRTPMNGVLGLTDLMLSSDLQDDQRQHLNMISSSGATLLRILDDILDFSKIEANMLNIQPAAFAPTMVVDEVAALFKGKIQESGLAYKQQVSNDIPKAVIGDSVRVKQILFNLLGNAIKFTPEGYVGLALNIEPAENTKIAKLRFTVLDSGIGISEADHAFIFEKFTQVEDVNAGITGTGLGLSISYNLASLMNGEITVESAEGKGSSFHLTIPFEIVPQEESEDLVATNNDRSTQKIPLRILMAEDNMVNQLVSQSILEQLGCNVILAVNGQEALDLYDPDSIDAILMDCNMPVMDGFEATRRIRHLEEDRGISRIPIIALTAHALDDIKARCEDAGMDFHLSKPFKAEALAELLKTATTGHN